MDRQTDMASVVTHTRCHAAQLDVAAADVYVCRWKRCKAWRCIFGANMNGR